MPVKASFGGGLVVAVVALAGCFSSHDGEGPGWVPPIGPCEPAAAPYEAPRCSGPGRCVDVLVVMDNRAAMEEEQVALFEQIPLLAEGLITGDGDGDGAQDTTPVSDLHFGVVTADIGSGGSRVDGCLSPGFGDDGILGRGRTGRLSEVCELDLPAFLSWSSDEGLDALRPWQFDAACSVAVGTFGCPYQQPLDAALKALTESRAPPRFFEDSCGHGDDENAGFLRADSVLAVFIVSDHDDCSVQDPSFFFDAAGRDEDVGLVCHEYRDHLHDVRRHIAGFFALREDPRDLVFVPVVGLPLAVTPTSSEAPDFDEILRHSDMQVRVDPSDSSRLAPSCEVGGRGMMFPPRRYMEVAQGLEAAGASTGLVSMCQPNFSLAIGAIGERL